MATATEPVRKEAATRREVARRLVAQLDRIEARRGEVAMAAEIQLLKRELARSHAPLAVRPEDNDWLSAVVLAEAVMASLAWKDYAPSVLALLREAFAAGEREAFAFDDYDALRQKFQAAGIPTGPILETDDGQEA